MRLYCFKSRSFRLPNIFLRRPVTMTFARKFKPQSLAPGRGSANAREALDCIEENSPLGEILQKAENNLLLQQALRLSLNKNGLEKAADLVKVGVFSESSGELKIYTNHCSSHQIAAKITFNPIKSSRTGLGSTVFKHQTVPQRAQDRFPKLHQSLQ